MKRTTMSDPNLCSSNGSSGKRSKTPAPPLSVPPGHVAFRLLCHASRIGGVIGKSGSIIKQLQQSTGTKIRVEEPPDETPDRVVTVIGPAAVSSMFMISIDKNAYGGNIINSYSSNGNVEVDDCLPWKEVKYDISKAQEGLIRVFERIVEVAAETDGVEMAVVSCRLLAKANQIGSLIGKGGKVVDKIRKDSGCRIRVLVENLSACAGPHDEVVEIEGDVFSVKKGLVAVSCRLQDYTPADQTRMSSSRPQEAISHEAIFQPVEGVTLEIRTPFAAISRESFPRPVEASLRESILRPVEAISLETTCRPLETVPMETLLRPLEAVTQESLPNLRVDLLSRRNSMLPNTTSSSINYSSGIQPLSLESNGLGIKMHQQDVSYKILCSNDRVGGVIGRGGSIIRALQSETGANINIGPTKAECDERLITVTSSENPESCHSPAQKTVIRIFSRLVEACIEKGFNSSSSPATARLVVASSQVGCLLGKGGAIVAEIRKVTGASIRILGGDQVPKCASDNDQVVQIFGEFSKVKDALYNVTHKLRDNIFFSTLNGTTRTDSSVLSETNSFEKAWDSGPLEMQSSVSVTHGHSRNNTLTHGMDHLGLPHDLDHSLSPRLWTSQMVTGVSLTGRTDVSRGLTHRSGGLELGSSGSKMAIVTNTTVEIVVPGNIIGCVFGENGSNLARLRQISGAKVIVHEPRLGSSERIIVISGTPDETQAAQSLLQAFILTAPSS